MRISVFAVIFIFILIMIGKVYYRSYIVQDFPIFIDEETISEMEAQKFGALADYL